MRTRSETLEIACLFCKGEVHQYSIEITTIPVIGLISEERELVFTHLFTCPKENKDFQATIRLYQESDERIGNIEIKNKPAAKD